MGGFVHTPRRQAEAEASWRKQWNGDALARSCAIRRNEAVTRRCRGIRVDRHGKRAEVRLHPGGRNVLDVRNALRRIQRVHERQDARESVRAGDRVLVSASEGGLLIGPVRARDDFAQLAVAGRGL